MSSYDGSAAAASLNVLYIEDFAPGAELVRDVLGRRAPEICVEIVSTVAKAVERLARFEADQAARASGEPGRGVHYDVVLTDMSLPDGLGLEVLSHVRNRGLPIAVVILTGAVDDETIGAARQAGADGYVGKRGDYLARLAGELHGAAKRMRLNPPPSD